MEILYQNKTNIVKVFSKFIYLEEIFEHTPKSCRLVNSRYLSCSKPIVRTYRDHKKDYKYDKKKKTSWIRSFTLLYAPENYLINMEYDLMLPADRLAYIKIDHEKSEN